MVALRMALESAAGGGGDAALDVLRKELRELSAAKMALERSLAAAGDEHAKLLAAHEALQRMHRATLDELAAAKSAASGVAFEEARAREREAAIQAALDASTDEVRQLRRAN